MKWFVLALAFLLFPSGSGEIWKYFSKATKVCVERDFDHNTHTLKKRVTQYEKKQIKKLSKILSERDFSFCSQNDTILIFLKFNPVFVDGPETIDAFSSLSELHLKLDNGRFVTNTSDPVMKHFPTSYDLFAELEFLINKKIIRYLKENDVVSFQKLYQMFAAQTIPYSPIDAFRVTIHNGRTLDSAHWQYSIDPFIIVMGEIEPGDTLNRIIDEKKNVLQKL